MRIFPDGGACATPALSHNIHAEIARIRRSAERSYRCGLGQAEIRLDSSGNLAAEAGCLGLATAEAVHLHPRLAAAPEALQAVLFHELAHAAQYRQGAAPRPPATVAEIEAEAHAAARAARAGRRFPIAPRQGMPAVCYWWPLIALAIVAGAGLTVAGSMEANDGIRRRAEQRGNRRELTEDELAQARRDAEKHMHEGWVGFVPLVGSFDQMVNGRNWKVQAGGAIFFVLDLTMVGGLVTAGMKMGSRTVATGTTRAVSSRSGEVVGVLIKPSTEGTVAMRQVARGGGTAAQNEAFEQVLTGIAQRELVFMSERGAMEQLARGTGGGSYLIVGTEGVTNHSVTYLVHGDKIFKLHGGVAKYAAKVGEFSRDKAVSVLTGSPKFGSPYGMNSATIYGPEHLAHLTDEAINGIVKSWGARGSGIEAWLKAAYAPGCSVSQAHLLQRFGVFNTGVGNRLLPVVLERSRRAGTGAHFILNPTRQTFGSGFVPGFGLGGYGLLRGGANGVNMAFSDLSDGSRPVGLSQNEVLGLVEVATAADGTASETLIVLEPVDRIDLTVGPQPQLQLYYGQ